MRLTYLMPTIFLISFPMHAQTAPKLAAEVAPGDMQEMVIRDTDQEEATETFLGKEPKIGIDEKNRVAVAKILKSTQANEFVLYVKTLNYHWNVLGMSFNDLHGFFGKQYGELADFIDMIAERVRALGLRPFSTMQEFITNAHLKEQPGQIFEAKEMLQNLLDDHETLIRQMRADIDACAQLQDAGTNNFLSELIVKHEKMAWMLRSYLSEK